MTRRLHLFLTLGLVLPGLMPGPLRAATAGWELLQHTVLPLDDGGLVTARVDREETGDWGVFVRRFDAAGQPRTPEIRANAWSAGDQWQPSLAPLSRGGFAVAWNSRGQDGSGWGLYLRRFDAEGEPLEPERLVSAPRGGDQTGAVHAVSRVGLVAAWTSPAPGGWRVLARRLSPQGFSLGPAVPLRGFTSGETFQQIAAGPGDDLTVVWAVRRRNPCGYRAQRFGFDGRPRTTPFPVCTFTQGGNGAPPQLSAGPGGYVAVWSAWGIWARRYSLIGRPLGATFRVDQSYTLLGAVPTGAPRVAHTPGGASAVVWETFQCAADCEADGHDIAWRSYLRDGKPRTDEKLLAPTGTLCRPGNQAPRIAGGGSLTRLAVAWLKLCAADGEEAPRLATAFVDPTPAVPHAPPPHVAFSGSLAGVGEEDGEAIVSVLRSAAARGRETVEYWTVPDGTATPGVDYQPVSGTLVWEEGDFYGRAIRIPVVADGLPEEPEWFRLLLRNPTGGLLASVNPIVVHIDHPGFLGFRADELPTWEDAGEVRVHVERRGGRHGAVSVRFGNGPSEGALEGLAEEGVDYLPVSGTLAWEHGDDQPKSFLVPLLDDPEVEDLEGFGVWLEDFAGGARGPWPGATFAWMTIRDDELSLAPGWLELAAATLEVREGDGGVEIPVRRHGGLGGTVSVRYATEEGSARAGADFTAASGVLAWEDSDLSVRTLRLSLVDDARPEGDETLEVVLSDPQGGAGLGRVSRLRLTIHDDDPPDLFRRR